MITSGFIIFSLVALFSVLPQIASQSCYTNTDSFTKAVVKKGYNRCTESDSYMYIGGFEKKASGNDDLRDLTMELCCQPPAVHIGKPFTIQPADWELSFQRKEGWATCPAGFFLHGFYREDSHTINSIRWATCAKPALHPYWYKDCYDHDLGGGTEWQCSRLNYYIVGFHRGSSTRLSSINKIRCCSMYEEVLPLKTLEEVKTRTMDMTMNNLGLLANYLGYGWCGGCRSDYSGEDFRREGDSWRSSYQEPCSGYMKKDRLKIFYENFAFKVKKMDYLNPELKSIKPIVQDVGQVKNLDALPVKSKVTREIKAIRTVVHSSEQRFGSSFGASVTLSYKSPPLSGVLTGTFSASVTLSGGNEASQIEKDDEGEITWDILRVGEPTTTNGNKGSQYQITVSKKQVDVPYKAIIQVQFTARLEGFMRWGGDDKRNANFHRDERGSGARKHISYTIGDATNPFYKFLKRASDRGDAPWLWHDMKQRYTSAQHIIDLLADETLYEFELNGKFKDVSGLDANIKWENYPIDRRNVTVNE